MLLVVLVVFGLVLMWAVGIWFTLCLHGWICFCVGFCVLLGCFVGLLYYLLLLVLYGV